MDILPTDIELIYQHVCEQEISKENQWKRCMLKVIGKGSMQAFSREIDLNKQVRVANLPELLQMSQELAESLIVVRGHSKLDEKDIILKDDEIYLFLAVMGG